MSWPNVVKRLEKGETVELRPRGNSMTPRIKSGQLVRLEPLDSVEEISVGEVVLAKVRGRYYLHLVSRIVGPRIEISNNHGHANGWTTRERVYAKVVPQ